MCVLLVKWICWFYPCSFFNQHKKRLWATPSPTKKKDYGQRQSRDSISTQSREPQPHLIIGVRSSKRWAGSWLDWVEHLAVVQVIVKFHQQRHPISNLNHGGLPLFFFGFCVFQFAIIVDAIFSCETIFWISFLCYRFLFWFNELSLIFSRVFYLVYQKATPISVDRQGRARKIDGPKRGCFRLIILVCFFNPFFLESMMWILLAVR